MNKRIESRIESDQLGEKQIPAGAYWGIKTARYCENTSISGLKFPSEFIAATMIVKKAAALANGDAGRLDPIITKAIVQAADEVLNNQWLSQFIVDPFQSGAVLAHNHNANELLANRGTEIMGGAVGTYSPIHPDRHVNLSQSANDVFPTAMRLAILLSLKDFFAVLLDLERLLRRKALEFDKIAKVGRTHLKDSAPITLGQEFNAFGSSIQHSYRRIHEASQRLLELNIGATEIGTGFNASYEYIAKVYERIASLTNLPLKPVDDYFRLAQSMSDFQDVSSSLKELAIELSKIANDMRLLSSGPSAGFAEIRLPALTIESSAVLPGLLPDRLEPVMTDSINLVATQVIGYDLTITLAAQAGQLELNAMMPVIVYNILTSLHLLKNALSVFNQHCIIAITANAARCRELLESSGLIAYALIDHLGSQQVAELLKQSKSTMTPLRELVIKHGLMSAELLDKALIYLPATRPILPKTESSTPKAMPTSDL